MIEKETLTRLEFPKRMSDLDNEDVVEAVTKLLYAKFDHCLLKFNV